MKPSEYMDFINELEMRFPVEKWKIDGIHVWPLIRMSLADDLHNQNMVEKKPLNNGLAKGGIAQKMLNSLKSIFSFIKASMIDFNHNAFVFNAQKDVVFLTHSITRNLINGQWYLKDCDPFIQSFKNKGIDTFTLEYFPNRVYKTPRYSPTKFIQGPLELIKIFNMLKRDLSDIKVEMEDFESFISFLKEKNIKIQSLAHFKREVYHLKLNANYYKKILKRLDAKVGFVVYYYGSQGMSFNLACHNLGIPSVDIQHGVQGELHRAYGRWMKVPVTGYEFLPTYFWCWSESEVNVINSWAQNTNGAHQAFNGGNMWLNLWKQNSADFVKEYNQKLQSINDSEVNILVSLQPDREFPEHVLEAINHSPSSYKWWIRLHPRMMSQRDDIKDVLKESTNRINQIIIDVATDLPLYALMNIMTVHITEWSSTVIEAESFGVPSLLIHDFGEEIFSAELDKGTARMALSGTEILRDIQLITDDHWKNTEEKDVLKDTISDFLRKIEVKS